MKRNQFKNMTSEELKAFRPRNDDEEDDFQKETKYRGWCGEYECDPLDPESRHAYREHLEETSADGWESMDEDDAAGWIDNMNKD